MDSVEGTAQVGWILGGEPDRHPGYAEVLVALDGVGVAVWPGPCRDLNFGRVTAGFLRAALHDSGEFGYPVRRGRRVEAVADSPGSRSRLGVTADDDGNARGLERLGEAVSPLEPHEPG